MLNNKPARFLAGAAAVLVVATGSAAFAGWMAPANVAWITAAALACGVALLALQRSSQPKRSIAEILYDTEQSGGAGR
jgi:hypothetical protein